MSQRGAGIVPRERRVQLIAERQEMPGRGQPILFGGRYRYFPIASVPLEALVYRIDNGRLAAELEEHAAGLGLSVEALGAKAETEALQQFLHAALIAKARDPDGPIYAELERLAQQTEPLIVLFDGTVVNGNRRLAAMRDLLARDGDRYATFRAADIAVLPENIAPREVEYIEASLQMAPETKLGYGWVDRRLKLRRQRDVLGLPLDEIKAAYRIEDDGQIGRELAELALAEDYLARFRVEPAHYSAVADAAELFIGLSEQLGQLDREQADFWRLAGFAMIEGRTPALQKRMEQLFPFAEPVWAEMPQTAQVRLARRFDIDGAGDLDDEAVLSAGAVEALRAVLNDRDRSGAVAEIVADTIDELRLEHGERNAPERMLQKVREAGRLIARLEPDRLTPTQRRSLRADLAALMAHGSFLLGEMGEKPAVPLKWNYTKPILRPPYWKVPWRIAQRLGLSRSQRGR
jgi:hypothetical protein